MKYPMEENMPYLWLALLVLVIFYGIYFAKMLVQKRQGVQTRQIGRVKEKSVQILQEERYLTENYGDSYREYRKHVFRYLGRKLRSREKKEAEEQRMFEMKQQKKREKHKGH